MTTLARTDHAQRSGSARAAYDVNFPSRDDGTANEAITFFVQRLPFTESIEPLQRLQLLLLGELERRQQGHCQGISGREVTTQDISVMSVSNLTNEGTHPIGPGPAFKKVNENK